MPIEIQLISSHKELKRYEAQWNALWNGQAESSPFDSFLWFETWQNYYAKSLKPFYVLVFDSQKLIAAIPFIQQYERQFGIKLCIVSIMANSHSYRTRILLDNAYRIEEIWPDIVKRISSHVKWDLLRFREFLVTDESIAFLRGENVRLKLRHSFEEKKNPPYLLLNNSWEELYNSLKGHFRRNLNRRVRNAEKQFTTVTHSVFNDKNMPLDSWLHDGFELENSGWKGENKSSILSKKEHTAFYLEMAQKYGEEGHFYSSKIYFGDKLVAFNYSFILKDVFYLLKVAYNQEYSKYSPGQIMIYYLLQDLFKRGIKEFDFLGPLMSWKQDWTEKVRCQNTLYIYRNTLKGWYTYGVNSHLLPFLRKYKNREKAK